MEPGKLDDGLIRVVIEGREPFDLDIYTAKLVIDEFEERHGVRKSDTWKMTSDASLDLQAAFRKIGVPVMSGALAVELWWQVNSVWEEVKKNWSFMPTTPPDSVASPGN